MGDVVLVATAGHIDHGKSTLVRALTGVDPDRLPEEQARGITIELGHATLALDNGRRIAFVDVPGHERLVRTMAAGAHGVDAAILVVAADDGVMPQTEEHLAILDLLGVPAGFVVITKADLVDDDLLELVAEDVAEQVVGTCFEGAPVLPVSAARGTGLDAVRAALAALSPRPRDTAGPARVPVDRVFSRPGFGVVATGTVASGRLAAGSTVRLLPTDRTARVRGLQVHGEDVDAGHAGQRLAVNLSGVEGDEVSRGLVLARGEVPCPHVLDVSLRATHGELPLEDGQRVRVLLHTAEGLGRLHLGGEAAPLGVGGEGFGQLRLDGPLPCLPGDRFVLRRESPVDTLGGGVVLDPWAARMRARDRGRVAVELSRLAAGERVVWLERAGETGLAEEDWRSRGGEGGVVLGGRVFARGVVARLEGVVIELLGAWHTEHPLALGAPRRDLRRGRLAHLPVEVFDALLGRLRDTGTLVLEGPLVRAAAFAVALSPAEQDQQRAVEAAVRGAGLAGLDDRALEAAVVCDSTLALAHLLEAEGTVHRVPELGWVHEAAVAEVQAWLRAWFAAQDGPLAPATARDGLGLTRRTVMPWLAFADARGWTRRDTAGRWSGERL